VRSRGFNLAPDNAAVNVHIFVRAPNDQLVHDTTRFWNAGGLQLSASASAFSSQYRIAGGAVGEAASSSIQIDIRPSKRRRIVVQKLYEDAASAQERPLWRA
jgi:paraquat-inducible protein B